MKIFEEKSTADGKIQTKESAAPPPKTTTVDAWIDRVYGATREPKRDQHNNIIEPVPPKVGPRPKLFDRADAVAVHDIKLS